MDDSKEDALAKIWEGDLFNRRPEADALQAYIESVGGRDLGREDAKAYTIAVDADYGIGKTYFLKRLARQLGQTHPVAFIDAWADDLADEPLVALASTLKQAFDPLIATHPTIGKKVANVIGKLGEVSKAVSWGVLKKAASLVVGEAAASEVADIVGDAFEDIKDDFIGAVSDGVSEGLDDAKSELASAAPSAMSLEIAAYRQTKANVRHLKIALRQLIVALSETDLSGPAIIFIDELDRCRPTYAVKVLEEIKHLFDVPGLVFVLGVNGEQLANSLVGAYGPNFKGDAYLRRFIDRRYRLATADLTELITKLNGGNLNLRGFQEKYVWPEVVSGRGRSNKINFSQIVSSYMYNAGMGARDAFTVYDALQLAGFLTSDAPLILPLILPMMINWIKGNHPDAVVENGKGFPWKFAFWGQNEGMVDIDPNLTIVQLNILAHGGESNLGRQYNNDDPVTNFAFKYLNDEKVKSNRLASPDRYRELLEMVGHFTEKPRKQST